MKHLCHINVMNVRNVSKKQQKPTLGLACCGDSYFPEYVINTVCQQWK